MGRCGKADDEGGSLPVGIVVAENLAAVLLHDAVADAEAEAGSLADLLGGEEGIENAVGMGDAVAVVAERNFHGVAGFGGHDLDAGGAADFMNRVVGVVQDVEENLLQLVSVADDIGQSFVEMFDDIDAVTVEVVRAQLDGAAQNQVELHGIALRRHLAGKAEQVLHDLFGALRFLQDDAQVFSRGVWQVGILQQQIGKAENRGQGIVYFVGDAGDELSDGCHFLGMNQFAAQFGRVGDVGHDHDDAVDVALLVAHGAEVDGELAGMAVAAHDLQFKIVDLPAAQNGLQRVGQRTTHSREQPTPASGRPRSSRCSKPASYQRRLA